jgi:hypothetical protein
MEQKRKADDTKSTQSEKKSKEYSYEARISKLEGDFASPQKILHVHQQKTKQSKKEWRTKT